MVWAGRVEKGGALRRTQTQKKWGFKGWGAPKGWGPEGWGGPKFRFFPSPSAKCILFFPLWVSSRGILGPSNVHVWSSLVVV